MKLQDHRAARALAQIDPNEKRVLAVAKMNLANETRASVHGALLAAGRVAARSDPIEKRTAAIQRGRDQPLRHAVERRHPASGDRAIERRGRDGAAELVNALQMLAKEIV